MKVGAAFLLLNAVCVQAAEKDVNSDDAAEVYRVEQASAFTIKGIVKDVNGEALIGVNIRVKGTTVGSITGLDGDFQLNVKKGDILIISYTGYATQEITIKNATALNITLTEDLKVLDEVVVTALGIKKETKALTYNVQELKPADMFAAKDANLMNSLAGKVAGVTINSSSSGVGGGARVVMRGTKSISGSLCGGWYSFASVVE